jgi:hypothetical protein
MLEHFNKYNTKKKKHLNLATIVDHNFSQDGKKRNVCGHKRKEG